MDHALLKQTIKISKYCKVNHRLPQSGYFEQGIFKYNESRQGLANPTYETLRLLNPEQNQRVNYRRLNYTFKDRDHVVFLSVALPLEGLNSLARSITSITLLTLLIVIVSSVLLTHYVINKLWHPFYSSLKLLVNYKIGSKQKIAFSATTTDEFGFMNQSLMNLILSAEKDYRILMEFTANASHELQTPLMVIRSKLDSIMQSGTLNRKQHDALNGAYQSVSRLASLSQSLLLLAKIEHGEYLQLRNIELKTIIEDKLEDLRDFWKTGSFALHLNLKESHLCINSYLADVLLNNLLSNASRHNKSKGVISITSDANFLQISNTSNSDSLDTDLIFTRFYKNGVAGDSNGLGLAIVWQICQQAGIQICYNYDAELHTFRLNWQPCSPGHIQSPVFSV